MLLLAQIADIFSKQVWLIIFIVGFGSPLVGNIIGATRRPLIRQRAEFLGFYYRMLMVFFALNAVLGESIALVVPIYLLLLAGPVAGIVSIIV
jgi:hypothetical protein